MPYSAYCLSLSLQNKRLDPVLCSIRKWLIGLRINANNLSQNNGILDDMENIRIWNITSIESSHDSTFVMLSVVQS